jgi:hypothetical protein
MSADVQDRDFEFFEKNRGKFYSEYGHKFLAIKNASVMGAFDTFDEAVKTALRTERPGTFIVQECSESSVNYTQIFQNNVLPAEGCPECR